MALLFTVTAVQAASPMYVSVNGPTLIASGETHQYNVTALGGPGEASGGYSFVVDVLSGDATVTPNNGESDDGTFSFNLTAGGKGMVVLSVEAVSTLGAEFDSKVQEYTVEVVEPVVISAKITNFGNVPVIGVPVTYLVDDVEVYNTSVDLAAGASITLRYNWTEAGLKDGEHTLTVLIDPDDQFVKFDNGDTTYTSTFYVGEEDYSTTNTVFILLVVVLGVLAFLLYRRKPVKKKKKGKRRKK